MKALLASLLLTTTAFIPSERTVPEGRWEHRTEQLVISRLTSNTFIHTSYHRTNDFGNVPCNGLVVRNGNAVVIFDTPTNDAASEELIAWVRETLRCTVLAVVPTHFHVDCLGGLHTFHAHGIPSFANAKTRELAERAGTAVPANTFVDSLVLMADAEPIVVKHFGEGHTVDNVVGWFAKERVLFGGCLVKELNATKGYLGDANVGAWSSTVERVKQAYPQVKHVVPGHGRPGGTRLLDHTIELFKTR